MAVDFNDQDLKDAINKTVAQQLFFNSHTFSLCE